MTRKGLGMTAVVDPGDHALGVFTDGDLRRAWIARRMFMARACRK